MAYLQEIPPVGVPDIAQTIVFKTLWDRLPSKSFISGLWLREYVRTPLWKNCFLNILPVKEYPYFRFYFGNIILCTPGERGLFMDGTEEERISYALNLEEKTNGRTTARWGEVKQLESELRIQYAKSFPTTRGMLIQYKYSLEEQKSIVGALNKQFWDSF